jgi:hypothetical protein
MWSTLALTATLALAPAQDASLKLSNPRATYGSLGAERTSAKLLPGDIYFISFDIENVTVGKDGKVLYSMGMQLTNKEGKVQFKKDPQEQEVYNSLGGSRLPAFAVTQIGLDTPPGEYTMTVTVMDRVSKKSDKLSSTFEVLPSAFGIVQFLVSYDYKVEVPAPPSAVPGQNFWVNFALVGFGIDTKTKQPNLSAELRVIDLETNKPVLPEGPTGKATEVTEQFKKILPMQFVLSLNRPGKFRMELTAKDNVGGKTAKQSLDFTITNPASK